MTYIKHKFMDNITSVHQSRHKSSHSCRDDEFVIPYLGFRFVCSAYAMLSLIPRIDTLPKCRFQGCRMHHIAMFQSYERIHFWSAVSHCQGSLNTLDNAGRKVFRKRRMLPVSSMTL